METAWAELWQQEFCVVVVMFLLFARARAGANEQSLDWLPVLLNTWTHCIPLTKQTNNRKQTNKPCQKTNNKTKQAQICNRTRDPSYNYWQKVSCRQSTYLPATYLLLTYKSERLWRKKSFHFAHSRHCKTCKAAHAISNQWSRLPCIIFKVCMSQQPLHHRGCLWIFPSPVLVSTGRRQILSWC